MSSIPSKKVQPAEVLVPILKSKVKYYNNTAKSLDVQLQTMEQFFVKSIVASKNTDLLLEYVKDNIVHKSLKDSSVLGVLSIIKPYTNAKGVSHLAHYSIYDNYIAPVSKMGAEPTGYQGMFAINKHLDKFRIVFPQNATEISDLFELIE
jgi:hypothetical protein